MKCHGAVLRPIYLLWYYKKSPEKKKNTTFVPVHQRKWKARLLLPLHEDLCSLMASFINTSCIPPKGAVRSERAKYISILQP